MQRVKANLRAIAFTRFGAYQGAKVLAVREEAAGDRSTRQLLPVDLDPERGRTLPSARVEAARSDMRRTPTRRTPRLSAAPPRTAPAKTENIANWRSRGMARHRRSCACRRCSTSARHNAEAARDRRSRRSRRATTKVAVGRRRQSRSRCTARRRSRSTTEIEQLADDVERHRKASEASKAIRRALAGERRRGRGGRGRGRLPRHGDVCARRDPDRLRAGRAG